MFLVGGKWCRDDPIVNQSIGHIVGKIGKKGQVPRSRSQVAGQPKHQKAQLDSSLSKCIQYEAAVVNTLGDLARKRK